MAYWLDTKIAVRLEFSFIPEQSVGYVQPHYCLEQENTNVILGIDMWKQV